VAQEIQFFLVEPVGFHDGARQEGPNHEMQPRPVGGETADGEPDEGRIPAVRLGEAGHEPAEEGAGHGKGEEEDHLLAHPSPVHQDQGQHRPDGDVVEAGVAEDALTQGLAEYFQPFHEQEQDGQGGYRAGHADAEDKLPGHGPGTHPAVKTEEHGGRQAAEEEGHAQGEPGRDGAFPAMGPGLAQVEFDSGDAHEEHDGPPGDAVEGLDDGRVEDEAVVIGKGLPQYAGAQEDAGDDLDHHEGRVVIGFPQAPEQVGQGEDDRHGDQENLGGIHPV